MSRKPHPHSLPLASVIVELPPASTQEQGVFKELNALSSMIMSDLGTKIHWHYKNTAAYLALSESLIEFLNNAADANATQMNIGVYFNRKTKKIEIVISDNGNGADVLDSAEPYNWPEAVWTASRKVGPDGRPCGPRGQHLALAITAFYLQLNGGSLMLQRNAPAGAMVTLTSSLEATCARNGIRDVYEIGRLKNLNVVEAMLVAILTDNEITTIFEKKAEHNRMETLEKEISHCEQLISQFKLEISEQEDLHFRLKKLHEKITEQGKIGPIELEDLKMGGLRMEDLKKRILHCETQISQLKLEMSEQCGKLEELHNERSNLSNQLTALYGEQCIEDRKKAAELLSTITNPSRTVKSAAARVNNILARISTQVAAECPTVILDEQTVERSQSRLTEIRERAKQHASEKKTTYLIDEMRRAKREAITMIRAMERGERNGIEIAAEPFTKFFIGCCNEKKSLIAAETQVRGRILTSRAAEFNTMVERFLKEREKIVVISPVATRVEPTPGPERDTSTVGRSSVGGRASALFSDQRPSVVAEARVSSPLGELVESDGYCDSDDSDDSITAMATL